MSLDDCGLKMILLLGFVQSSDLQMQYEEDVLVWRSPVRMTAVLCLYFFIQVCCLCEVVCFTLRLYEPYIATFGSRPMTPWWVRVGWSRAWMRACWACVWERSEISSSHPSRPMEKRDLVSISTNDWNKSMWMLQWIWCSCLLFPFGKSQFKEHSGRQWISSQIPQNCTLSVKSIYEVDILQLFHLHRKANNYKKQNIDYEMWQAFAIFWSYGSILHPPK